MTVLQVQRELLGPKVPQPPHRRRPERAARATLPLKETESARSRRLGERGCRLARARGRRAAQARRRPQMMLGPPDEPSRGPPRRRLAVRQRCPDPATAQSLAACSRSGSGYSPRSRGRSLVCPPETPSRSAFAHTRNSRIGYPSTYTDYRPWLGATPLVPDEWPPRPPNQAPFVGCEEM